MVRRIAPPGPQRAAWVVWRVEDRGEPVRQAVGERADGEPPVHWEGRHHEERLAPRAGRTREAAGKARQAVAREGRRTEVRVVPATEVGDTVPEAQRARLVSPAKGVGHLGLRPERYLRLRPPPGSPHERPRLRTAPLGRGAARHRRRAGCRGRCRWRSAGPRRTTPHVDTRDARGVVRPSRRSRRHRSPVPAQRWPCLS